MIYLRRPANERFLMETRTREAPVCNSTWLLFGHCTTRTLQRPLPVKLRGKHSEDGALDVVMK